MLRSRGEGRDFVDKMLEEIHAETPDVDTHAMAAVSRISRAAFFFQAAVSRVAAKAGITHRELLLLAALRRAGPTFCLSPGQLLKECFAPSSTMTRQLDRLTSLGLVERKPDPNDRRGVLVKLTPRGRRLIDSTVTLGVLFDERELRAIQILKADEIEVLNRILHKVLVVLESEGSDNCAEMLVTGSQSLSGAKQGSRDGRTARGSA
jgi:DNA-binding MarR family transcriptional regulator